MSAIKAFIIDLGGVLVELDISLFFQDIYAPFPMSRPKTPFMLKFFKQSEKYHMGQMSDADFYHLSCEILQIKHSEISQAQFFDAFNKIISGINSEMVQILRKIAQSKQYMLICLSNINQSHWDYLNAGCCDFLDYFDEIILSHHVSLLKPDQRIFKLAIEKAACKPQEIIYIDDGIKNVKAAELLGIKGIIFQDASHLRKELKKFGIKI
ncbi:MAG: Alpha-D-glucose-1-phosphate phosphatase YihX [Promethearchaeota archaeon]|nr:MAG: Alpha-D-glucose-1-phosphate phosphatase YihX [Candidatus Lokiarchaeota archaeon]